MHGGRGRARGRQHPQTPRRAPTHPLTSRKGLRGAPLRRAVVRRRQAVQRPDAGAGAGATAGHELACCLQAVDQHYPQPPAGQHLQRSCMALASLRVAEPEALVQRAVGAGAGRAAAQPRCQRAGLCLQRRLLCPQLAQASTLPLHLRLQRSTLLRVAAVGLLRSCGRRLGAPQVRLQLWQAAAGLCGRRCCARCRLLLGGSRRVQRAHVGCQTGLQRLR